MPWFLNEIGSFVYACIWLGFLLAIPGLIVNYVAIPIYCVRRPKLDGGMWDLIYTLCVWAMGLLPVVSPLISVALGQLFPQLKGGGDPGLDMGYDIIPILCGGVCLISAHGTVWVLLFAFRGKNGVVAQESSENEKIA